MVRPLYRKYGVFDCVIAYKEGPIVEFGRRAFRYKKFISWWHCASFKVSPSEFPNYERLDKIVAVSPCALNVLHAILPETKENSDYISNMIDTDRIIEMANKDIDIVISKKQGFRLLTVARLSPEKHLENVIESAVALKEKHIEFLWHIVGGGPLFEKLEQRIKEAGVENCVILEGEKNNPYPYMTHADLYVSTSYIESQGLTILEAMTLGVPCVVTKSLGPCEFIEDGVNGLLAEKNSESLTKTLLEILSDRELFEKIRENTHCPERFLPETIMSKFDAMLEEII